MIDIRAAVGAVSAWRILKRHPCYREAWGAAAERIARPEGEPVPVRRQTEADLEAAPWGLLAWEDPLAEDGPASPFWADAPMTEGMPGRRETPRFEALVRSQNGRAEGGAGRASVTLPDCLSPLSSGRAALAGKVRDPFLHMSERVTRERREEDCGASEHGEGRTFVREVIQAHNGRGDPVGDPVEGPWQLSIDLCRADYSQWEHYTLVCHWDAGAPHNRRMEGREVWRRLRSVTADGESFGTPEFVSTSCWTGDALPPPPTPDISETAREEMKSGSCPAGYVGSIGYRRTVTLRSTRFPWDAAPVTQTIYGAWTVARDDCVAEPEPDVGHSGGDPGGGHGDDPGGGHGDDPGGGHGGDPGGGHGGDPGGGHGGGPGGGHGGDPGGGHGGDPGGGHGGDPGGGHGGDPGGGHGGGPDGGHGGGPGGSGGPGGDACGGDPDGGGSSAGSGVCGADGAGGGGGGGDGGGGGCFLTTAVTERRGEADGGPALTVLRRFRDGYMARTAGRRALVEEYYAIAPGIVAAIPADHAEWEWIAGRIDAAVATIAAGADDEAFGIYVAMVRRLQERWTAGAVHDGGRP